METRSAGKRIWTWVSEDGKHAAAGISPGPGIGMKLGAHEEDQPFSRSDGRYVSFTLADAGGISGGSEVRGKVSPPQKPKYPPPPAPREPHLTYSIEREAGTLRDPQGQVMTGKGYSGYGADRNKAASQDKEDLGPIPEGNWRLREIMDSDYRNDLKRPIYRLEPDPGTKERFGKDKIDRKPYSMLIHGGRDPQTSSRGCIILDKETRVNLKQYEGRWIRVVK